MKTCRLILLCLVIILPHSLWADESKGMLRDFLFESQLLMDEGNVEEARSFLEQGISLYADEPEMHFLLGNVNHDLGFPAEAEAAYQEALRIHPGYIKALYALANLYRSLERRQDAINIYDTIAAIDPSSAAPHFEKVIVYNSIGRFGESRLALEQAYQLNPDFVTQSARLQKVDIDDFLARRELGNEGGLPKTMEIKQPAKQQSDPVLVRHTQKEEKALASPEKKRFAYQKFILPFLTVCLLIWSAMKIVEIRRNGFETKE